MRCVIPLCTLIAAGCMVLSNPVVAGPPDDGDPAAAPQPLRASADVVEAAVVPALLEGTAGGEVTFSVKLEIADGWHLYDHGYVLDPESFYFGIDLMPAEEADLAGFQPSFPPGEPGEFLGEKVSLIYKKAEIAVTVRLPDSVEGLVTVPLVLTVQACDSKLCLQPSFIPLEARVQVE
jgi:hypothetical protein